MKKRPTKATRGKLERALEQLESFIDSADYEQVVRYDERRNLENAASAIRNIESRLALGR